MQGCSNTSDSTFFRARSAIATVLDSLGDIEDAAIFPRYEANPVNEADRADYFDSLFHSDAVVGINAQGAGHVRTYYDMPGARLVALCDVDSDVLANFRNMFECAEDEAPHGVPVVVGQLGRRNVIDRRNQGPVNPWKQQEALVRGNLNQIATGARNAYNAVAGVYLFGERISGMTAVGASMILLAAYWQTRPRTQKDQILEPDA